MSKIIRAAFAVAAVGIVAGASQAAPVAMYGEYHESNGIIVNIPQNPPIVLCNPPPLLTIPAGHNKITAMGQVFVPSYLDLRPTGPNDARCHDRESHFPDLSGGLAPGVFNKPRVGNKGARIANGGLNVGDPFTIPPFAFQQQLGKQIGAVLNNVTRQLDTTFIAAMPGTDRISGMGGGNGVAFGPYSVRPAAAQIPAPGLTRMFSQNNWQVTEMNGGGQNNGANPTAMNPTIFRRRGAADLTHVPLQKAANVPAVIAGGNEQVQVRYRSGPRDFGGTMALLLDGSGKLWLGGVPITGGFPQVTSMMTTVWRPGAATQPVGDNAPGYRLRNAAGWDIAAVGFQNPGRVKAFFGSTMTPGGKKRVADPCIGNNPPTPAGCNAINGFDTFMNVPPQLLAFGIPAGGTVGGIPKATSTKHLFPLTTGTVSIVRAAKRDLQGGVQTNTITGMGYDTVGVTSMGVNPQRNVGLVAGSYSIRTSFPPAGPDVQVNTQLLGLNLKFTPEPGATVALASGLGLLGLLAYRRRA